MKHTTSLKKHRTLIGILFLLPSVLFILFSNLIPFIWNTILSFQKWDGFGAIEWVGMNNFKAAFNDGTFLLSTKNSMVLGIFSTLVTVFLGVILAFAIFQMKNREGSIYRLILFMPSLLPMSVIGLMFTFILSYEYGILNVLLRAVGLSDLTKNWLSDQHTVMTCLVLIRGWKSLGMTMLLCIAAMQGVPQSLFEAARLDGASAFKIYLRIVFPLILPVIALSLINTLMGAFKSFDTVKILTNGGPGRASYVVPMYMVDNAFKFGKFGYSAAMGTLFTIIVIICIAIVNRLARSEKYEF